MAKSEIVGDTIHAEVEIAAPPEKVFRALTEPGQLVKWWGSESVYVTTYWEMDLKPGGRWRSVGKAVANGEEFQVEGEVLEVDPPRVLSYSWNPTFAKIQTTVVRYALEATSTGTKVSVTHSGFADKVQEMHAHSQGWIRVLDWLGSYLKGLAA
ncbi:MAG TPA: SRPBCC domain-containing protein [Blastocatellia bacterium]|nr:SRPBCC domain-containing protein [Blastocatellia bacterium]